MLKWEDVRNRGNEWTGSDEIGLYLWGEEGKWKRKREW